MRLPDLSGFEVMDRLAEDPVTRNIPVVVCTFLILFGSKRNPRAILSKATLTRELMQRALADAWEAAPSEAREPSA